MSSETAAPDPLRVLVGMRLGGLQGGAERLLADLLGHATTAGMEIHLVCFEDGALVERARAAGIRVTVVPVGHHRDPIAGLRAIRRVRSIIADEDPDVVLSWLALAHIWMAPAAVLTRRRRRLVWWQHHIARGEPLEALIGFFPAARVVACSRAAAEAQEARLPHRRCHVVHPGIDPPTADPVALRAARDAIGAPADASIIGSVGRLVRWKGHQHFIDAVAALKESGREVTGVIVGAESYGLDAGFAGELRQLARARGVADRIVFTGQVDDPYAYIAALDVLVSASDGEPFGLTLVEAMALGTPVVAVGRGGPLEIVQDGVSGLLVRNDDGRALAVGVERILADQPLAERLAAAGAERFAAHFTAERSAIATERVLRPVAPRRPAAAV